MERNKNHTAAYNNRSAKKIKLTEKENELEKMIADAKAAIAHKTAAANKVPAEDGSKSNDADVENSKDSDHDDLTWLHETKNPIMPTPSGVLENVKREKEQRAIEYTQLKKIHDPRTDSIQIFASFTSKTKLRNITEDDMCELLPGCWLSRGFGIFDFSLAEVTAGSHLLSQNSTEVTA